jgi:hypothetical protein
MNVTAKLHSFFRKPAKSVLVSYLKGPMDAPKDDPLTGHSNRWESREIVGLLERMDLCVDVIDWTDSQFQPRKEYLAVIDIYANLQRLAPHLSKSTRLLLHATGSDASFNAEAERQRTLEFERRTGLPYSPKRIHNPIHFSRSLEIAHCCSLLGNEQILMTFPEEYRKKISLIPVTGSILARHRTPKEMAALITREFLWFFGPGAVHKGLDLVLEVFARRRELVLHVAGLAHEEPDFMAAYGRKMSAPNIRVHGWIDPASSKFAELFKNVFCFIAPSCAEGTSTAAITCLQFGFLPIISRACGVTLPPNAGIILETLSEAAIERAIDLALRMSPEIVTRETIACQSQALRLHSREAFSLAMDKYLRLALSKAGDILTA